MEFVKVTLTALLSFGVLFILTKLMGQREISQMSMFDYISGITIGSIAADLATDAADTVFHPLIAMIVYSLAVLAIAKLTGKSIKLRRFVTGRTIVLFENGKLYEENLKKTKIDINEFQSQCRNQGYFNLDDIQTAVLETNGKLSILPKSQKRPVNPEDLKLPVSREGLVTNIIIDGKLLRENLKSAGKDENWLNKQLSSLGASDMSQIMLAAVDINGKLSVYRKKHGESSNSFDK